MKIRAVSSIARREILSNFVTPIAYVIIAGFMILSGFFFFSLLMYYNANLSQAAMHPEGKPNLNEWVISPFFKTIELVLVFLIPLLTMRTIAEEKGRGTFELLATSPLTIGELVWGKFLGISVVALSMLLLSFIYPLALIVFSDPERAPIFIGFLGLVLFLLSFLSLGLIFSSLSRSQTVAGVMALIFLLLFYVVDMPAAKLPPRLASFVAYLSPARHTELMLKGVIDSANIVYFLTLILFGLFITSRILEGERWRS